jgi:hypothetical protein
MEREFLYYWVSDGRFQVCEKYNTKTHCFGHVKIVQMAKFSLKSSKLTKSSQINKEMHKNGQNNEYAKFLKPCKK